MLAYDEWKFCTKISCSDFEPILKLRDRSLTRSWLSWFKKDQRRLTAMRKILLEDGQREVSRLSDDEVVGLISEMLACNRLHIHVRPPLIATSGGAATEAEAEKFVAFPIAERKQRNQDKEDNATPLTWIEVRLIDLDNNPVAGERYRIRLPNSSLREGNLDSKGTVRIEGIIPGQATISFPDIDGREWTAK